MFTGIIETTGKVISSEKKKSNLSLAIESPVSKHLKIGQSVAHNGVCLTVEKISSGKKIYFVTAVKETLDKTNLGLLKKGNIINLERSLKIGSRLDGHFVQGHVDTIATVISVKQEKGSWIFKFKAQGLKPKGKNLILEKGSICINGVSLTIVQVSSLRREKKAMVFSVAIIPHTFRHTNFSYMKNGDAVNIEFDIMGKYIKQILSSKD